MIFFPHLYGYGKPHLEYSHKAPLPGNRLRSRVHYTLAQEKPPFALKETKMNRFHE